MSDLEKSLRKVNSAGWEGTPLAPGSRFNPITYEDKVIKALRPKSILDRVANLKFTDNIECGAPTARISEPEGYVQPIEEDGQMKPQEFEYGCETFMDIEYGFGCLRKMSKEQKNKFMCNDPAYMNMLMGADTKEGSLILEKVVLKIMRSSVHASNKGLNAGVTSGIYNMGSPANSCPWNPETAEESFQDAKMIFNEWNIDADEQGMSAPFAIGHPFIEKAMMNNDRLSSYFHMGNCLTTCPRVSGAMQNMIYGFDVIKTPCLGSIEVDGITRYPILFGFKDATDVVVEFEQVDRDYPIIGDRSYIYEKWWDFGVKVWDGRKLAIKWVHLEE